MQFQQNTTPSIDPAISQLTQQLPSRFSQSLDQPQPRNRPSPSSSSQNSSSSPSPHNEQDSPHEEHPHQDNTPQDPINAGPMSGRGQGERKIRYKYCCKVCKHTDKSKKACICVVPKDQRRTDIGEQGCQTCGCDGCSREDFISRGEDPEYHPGQTVKKKDRDIEFQARNGCCRKCMKAFSKSNKSCLCQVPEDVRNTKLPSTGCKICGCFGCNPEDKKDPRLRKTTRKQVSRSRSREKGRNRKQARSSSNSSSSQSEKAFIDPSTMNFYNVDKSILGGMMVNQFRIDPALVGFGIPQRSHSYIMGKPK